MKDKGLDLGLVQSFETSDRRKGNMWGFRKMFWTYLNKLNVPFSDSCCDAATSGQPLRLTEGLEYFDATSKEWTPFPATSTPLPAARIPGGSTAINVTADPTAANIVDGLITSTSAAAVAMTLPTVASIVAIIGSVRGTTLDFAIDNGVGANTITLTAGTGMTASSALTGGTTLTVASGVVGQFRLYIQSGTTAKLSRIA